MSNLMWHFSLFQVRQFSIIPRSFFRPRIVYSGSPLKNILKVQNDVQKCSSRLKILWKNAQTAWLNILRSKNLASVCFISEYLMKILVHKKIWVHTPSDYIWVRCDLYQSKLWTCHPYHVIVRKKGQPTGRADLLTYEQDYSCSDLIQGCHSLIMSVSETMPDLNCAA